MQSNKGRDTVPELKIRRLLHAAGLRYRVNRRPLATLRRTADIVFTRARVAVFIDGCFWHGCPDHYQRPNTNRAFWDPKVQKNRIRDAETTSKLAASGWTVLRFWEHEDPGTVAATIISAVRRSTVTSKSNRPLSE